MYRAALVIAVSLAAAGLAAGFAAAVVSPVEQNPPDCLYTLEYKQVVYKSLRPAYAGVRRGRFEGRGVIPACRYVIEPGSDYPGQVLDQQRADVRVYRVNRVDPAIALLTARDDGVYLARGFLLALPSHPLHDAFFGPEPTSPQGDCRNGTTSVAGRTLDWPTHVSLAVDVAHHRGHYPAGAGDFGLNIALGDYTHYRGARRLGLPYVRRGAPVRIDGVFCSLGPSFSREAFFALRLRTAVPRQPAR